jgi:hypothetical protein
VSPTPKPPATLSLGGVIEDPPIADALIYLEGKAQAARSDAQGHFTLEITPASRTSGILRSQGGKDHRTGALFTDLSLATPLALFDSGETVLLSPATTLVVAVMAQEPDPFRAQERVRTWLGLPDDLPLTRRPTEDPRMLQRTLFLTHLARQFEKPGEAFGEMAAALLRSENPPLFDKDGGLQSPVFETLLGNKDQNAGLEAFYAGLAMAHGNMDIMVQRTRNHLLTASLMGAFKNAIGPADPLFQDRQATYAENMVILAETLAKREDAFADDPTMARFLRYTLPTLRLLDVTPSEDSQTGYTVSGPLAQGRIDAADLASLHDDPLLAEILKTSIPYRVEVPLMSHDHPGDDNDKRMHYYFNSNLSPVLQAERLMDRVYDDETRDAVLAQVVKARARAGFFHEAQSIIQTRMYDSLSRADAWIYLARAHIAWSRFTDARAALREAEKLLFPRIRHKGETLDSSDINQLLHILAEWAKIQDTQAMQSIMDFIDEEILGLNLSTTNHGRIAMAALRTVDAMLEAYPPRPGQAPAQELTAALGVLLRFSETIPPNESRGQYHYKLKVYMLADTAQRYADAGFKSQALAIIDTIHALRQDDGLRSETPSGLQNLNLTLPETHVYMPTLAAILFSLEEEDLALQVARDLPDQGNNARYKARAYAHGADYYVRQGNLEKAMEFVALYSQPVSTLRDAILVEKIRALTFETSQIPRGAEILLRKGDATGALRLLERALFYADAMDPLAQASPADRISRKLSAGYARIAPLFMRAGDENSARILLEKAETLILGGRLSQRNVDAAYLPLVDTEGRVLFTSTDYAPLTDPVILLDAWMALARAWDACQDPRTAENALDAAEKALQNQFGTRATLQVMNAGLSLLSLLTETQRTARARNLAVFLSPKAEGILDEAGDDTDKINKATKDTADIRVRLARQFREAGWADLARMELDTAFITALGIFSENDRIGVLSNIAEGYALAGDTPRAVSVADQIPYLARKNAAYLRIGSALANHDDFPHTDVAFVDTDKDGRPNFFHPLATPEQIRLSGLELDMDSDGDGIPDILDPTPLYRNP